MTIEFKCLHCRTELTFTDDQADQRIDCESCGKPIKVPAPFAGKATRRGINTPLATTLNSYDAKLGIMEFSCPGCRNEVQALKENAGDTILCKECNTMLRIPTLPKGDERQRLANRPTRVAGPRPTATQDAATQDAATQDAATDAATDTGGRPVRHDGGPKFSHQEVEEAADDDESIVDLTIAGWIVMAIAASVSLGTGFYVAVLMSFADVQPKVVAGAGLLSFLGLLGLVYFGSRAVLGACGIPLDSSPSQRCASSLNI